MANKEYSSHIKRVLKSYQSSAVKGLHGPSPYMNSDNDERSKKTELNESTSNSIKIYGGYKKFLQRQVLLSAHQQQSDKSKQSSEDCTQIPCTGYTSNRASCCPTSKSDVADDVDLKYQQRLKSRLNLTGDASHKCHVFDLCSSASDCGGKGRPHQEDDLEKCPVSDCKGASYPYSYHRLEDEKWLDKRAVASATLLQFHQQKETREPQMFHDVATTQSSTPNSHGGWADVGAFTPPSPHSPTSYSSPPHAPFPFVMGHADVCGGQGEALLEGQKVACFIIGGERRLCFPQVLCTSLNGFSMTQIHAECQALHIYLSLCSKKQLQVLKDAGALPQAAKSSGLITYSDAHRLTHALVHANAPQIDPPKTVTLPYNSSTHQFVTNSKSHAPVNCHSSNQLLPNIIVSHRCFGKCRGWVYLSLYDHPHANCIQCCECRSFYSPQQFVCHAHRSLETLTCHWGFDPANWRMYLQLASDQPLKPHSFVNAIAVLPETFLEQFKTKFANATRQKQTLETELDHSDPDVPAGDTPSYHHQLDSLAVRNRPDIRSLGSDLDGDCRDYVTIIDERQPSQTSVSVEDAADADCGGRLATLSVPSKSGKSFAPPPAALVRESMPAPLPPNLRSKGPPMLADPEQVVPLSQYDKFRHYQPNITLAPPKRRGGDSQRELCTSETSLGEISRKSQDTTGALDRKDVVVKYRCRLLAEQEREVHRRATFNSGEKQDSSVLHARTDGRSYSISLCQDYKSVDERQLKTLNQLSKEYASNGASVIITTDRDSSDCKQYFTSQDLGLLPIGGASVPKDLQIIKLDATFAGDGRCGRETRGAAESTPTDLKIFKLAPPTEQSAEAPEEKYSHSREFAERRKSECVAPTSQRVFIKKEVTSDFENGNTCTFLRKHMSVPVREIQQCCSAAGNYGSNRSEEQRKCSGMSENCGKCKENYAPHSSNSSNSCRQRNRLLSSQRFVKAETSCRCGQLDPKRTISEIASLLERWPDKESATRVFELALSLASEACVSNDFFNNNDSETSENSMRATNESLRMQVPSCSKSYTKDLISPRSQSAFAAHGSASLVPVSSTKNDGTCRTEKIVVTCISPKNDITKQLNESKRNSDAVTNFINNTPVNRDRCEHFCEKISADENLPLKTNISPVGEVLNCDEREGANVVSDANSIISAAENSDAESALVSTDSKIVASGSVTKFAVVDVRPGPLIKNASDESDTANVSEAKEQKVAHVRSSDNQENEGVAVGAACKRQLQEDRAQASSPELKARIRSLESELTNLKVELHSCKKQKTGLPMIAKSDASDSNRQDLCTSSLDEPSSSNRGEKVPSRTKGFQHETKEERYNRHRNSVSRYRSKFKESRDRRTQSFVIKQARRLSDATEEPFLSEQKNIEERKSLKRLECPEDSRTKPKVAESPKIDSHVRVACVDNRQSDATRPKDTDFSEHVTSVRICDERENRRKLEAKGKTSKP